MSKQQDYIVVWSGRDPLLPEREERWDRRFDSMPSMDIDEPAREVRKYTRSGRYKKVRKQEETNGENE